MFQTTTTRPPTRRKKTKRLGKSSSTARNLKQPPTCPGGLDSMSIGLVKLRPTPLIGHQPCPTVAWAFLKPFGRHGWQQQQRITGLGGPLKRIIVGIMDGGGWRYCCYFL